MMILYDIKYQTYSWYVFTHDAKTAVEIASTGVEIDHKKRPRRSKPFQFRNFKSAVDPQEAVRRRINKVESASCDRIRLFSPQLLSFSFLVFLLLLCFWQVQSTFHPKLFQVLYISSSMSLVVCILIIPGMWKPLTKSSPSLPWI